VEAYGEDALNYPSDHPQHSSTWPSASRYALRRFLDSSNAADLERLMIFSNAPTALCPLTLPTKSERCCALSELRYCLPVNASSPGIVDWRSLKGVPAAA